MCDVFDCCVVWVGCVFWCGCFCVVWVVVDVVGVVCLLVVCVGLVVFVVCLCDDGCWLWWFVDCIYLYGVVV